jgi:hypothetical protein
MKMVPEVRGDFVIHKHPDECQSPIDRSDNETIRKKSIQGRQIVLVSPDAVFPIALRVNIRSYLTRSPHNILAMLVKGRSFPWREVVFNGTAL